LRAVKLQYGRIAMALTALKYNVRTAHQQGIKRTDVVYILVRIRQLVQNVAHRVQPGTLLVVRLDGSPWGVGGIGVKEDGFPGLGVVIPFVQRSKVDSRKLPLLGWMRFPLLEAPALLFAAGREPDLVM
jgi:hypothetical protein